VSKTNEWELLRRQFDALTHDESVESVEDIFDVQFRRRFTELISHAAETPKLNRNAHGSSRTR
jgi:hypothetical protein